MVALVVLHLMPPPAPRASPPQVRPAAVGVAVAAAMAYRLSRAATAEPARPAA
jgi:hypothetical protein